MADESDRLARLEVMVTHLTSQMDKVVAAVSLIAKLQTEHDHHKDALGRAFEKIETADSKAEILESEVRRIDAKLNKYIWIGTGLGFGASAVWIVVAWVLKNDVVSLLSAIAKAGGAE